MSKGLPCGRHLLVLCEEADSLQGFAWPAGGRMGISSPQFDSSSDITVGVIDIGDETSSLSDIETLFPPLAATFPSFSFDVPLMLCFNIPGNEVAVSPRRGVLISSLSRAFTARRSSRIVKSSKAASSWRNKKIISLPSLCLCPLVISSLVVTDTPCRALFSYSNRSKSEMLLSLMSIATSRVFVLRSLTSRGSHMYVRKNPLCVTQRLSFDLKYGTCLVNIAFVK